MNITIRQEQAQDYDTVYQVVKEAFKTAQHSDGEEHNLVNRLRHSEGFLKELSLVAVEKETLLGHIMFTKIIIEQNGEKHPSLALAPLSVGKEFQNAGVGSALVKEGLKKAKKLGYSSVVVLGSELYYPRFGFREAAEFDIHPPFEVPSKNFMVIELVPNALNTVHGTVCYAKEFFE